MKKVTFLFLILFLYPATLLADGKLLADEADPAFFTSWIKLCDLLRSQNINPASPSWATIIPVCQPLKKSEDESNYNRCLYEKSVDQFDWPDDLKYCNNKADMKYREQQQIIQSMPRIVVNDGHGNKSAILQDSYDLNPILINGNPAKDRSVYFYECMMLEKHWRSAGGWIAGRQKPLNP